MIINGFTDADYLRLQDELGMYFLRDYYETNEELREEFEEFKNSGLYKEIMEQLGYPKVNINTKHWKLCKTCHRPFLARDRRGMEVTCYRYPTKRFRLSSRTFTNDNYLCYNKYRVGITMKHRKKQQDNQAS